MVPATNSFQPDTSVNSFLLADDLVVFEPAFGAALAIGKLAIPVRGTGLATADGRAFCIEHDVIRRVTSSVKYSTPSCPVPGSGRLTIDSLSEEQLSSVVTDGGKPVVLAAGRFTAKLEVLAPAIGPPPASSPDATRSYRGTARFQTVGIAPEGE